VKRAILIWAALCWAITANARTLYQSDFKSQPDGAVKLKQWALGGGKYRAEKGWLRVTSSRSNPLATLRVKHTGDATFRATVRNARNNHRTALIAHGWRLEINNQHVRMELHAPAGRGTKLVAHGPYRPFSRFEQTFELRLVFAGRKVCGFIDSRKVVEHEADAPVAADGPYALMGGWGTNVAWCAISLSDKPDLTEWAAGTLLKPAPKGIVEVTRVRGLKDDNIYFDGEAAGLRVSFATRRVSLTTRRRDPAKKTHLRFRLVDVHQRTVAEQVMDVSLAATKSHDLTVKFRVKRRGCFKVALDAGTGPDDLGWVEDLGGFTVVARALHDAPRDPTSYFGGHMDGINLEWHLRAGRKIGIQWARCHDMLQHTWWTRVQPRRDVWKWGDKTQATVDRLGLSTLGEFLWTPAWATSAKAGKRQAAPPKDLADFGRYVFEMVKHHRKSIRHWEVWNEPHYRGFWTGTPEQYARLLETAYAQAKKADPDCVVLGGGGVYIGRIDWTRRMLAALKGKPMDAFSIHYVTPDGAAEQLGELRRLLAERGLKDVPIWNTEASVPTTSFFDQCRAERMEPEARYHFRNACYELVRMYMENIANGVTRVFHYHQADPWRFRAFAKPRVLKNSPLGTGMWDEGRALKPIAAAHAALAHAIRGARYKERLSSGARRVFIFEGKGRAVAVQYAEFRSFLRREKLRLALPPGVKSDAFTVIDFMGNESRPVVEDGRIVLPLSCEPVYLVCRRDRAASVLAGMYKGSMAKNDK
jgi:hypothetical protein